MDIFISVIPAGMDTIPHFRHMKKGHPAKKCHISINSKSLNVSSTLDLPLSRDKHCCINMILPAVGKVLIKELFDTFESNGT